MEWDKDTLLAILGTSGVAAFWKPLLRLLTGQAIQREKDIDRLEERLEKETVEVKTILQGQIAELKLQVATLSAQNAVQQKMIIDQSIEISILKLRINELNLPEH